MGGPWDVLLCNLYSKNSVGDCIDCKIFFIFSLDKRWRRHVYDCWCDIFRHVFSMIGWVNNHSYWCHLFVYFPSKTGRCDISLKNGSRRCEHEYFMNVHNRIPTRIRHRLKDCKESNKSNIAWKQIHDCKVLKPKITGQDYKLISKIHRMTFWLSWYIESRQT